MAASLYVDGQLEAHSSGTTLNPVADVHFLVGGIYNVSYQPQATYTGLIDNVAVWNNSLSASDVQERYASEVGAPEPGTIAMMPGGALALGLRRWKSTARLVAEPKQNYAGPAVRK